MKQKLIETCRFPQRWPPPDAPMQLDPEDVHVWRGSLEPPVPIVERLQRLLSRDEQTRANRFRFEIHRRRFMVARGWLRTILARYLETDPGELEFAYTEHGKPYLASRAEKHLQLKFNVAHSRSLALYAFNLNRDVGVDIEYISEDLTSDEIARRFFSTTEVACLRQLSASARHEAFFRCWTLKEAFLKAQGMGLSLPLDQFDVAFTEDSPMVLRTRWDENEAARWTLRAIEVGPGYVGAVAVEGHDWRLRCWQVDQGFLI